MKKDWNETSFKTLELKDCWCSRKYERKLGLTFSFSTPETVYRLCVSWLVLPAPGCPLNSGSAETFHGILLAWSLASVSKGSRNIWWELSTYLLLSREFSLCPSKTCAGNVPYGSHAHGFICRCCKAFTVILLRCLHLSSLSGCLS